MLVRTARRALALALATPLALSAQDFSYAAGTGQYRITSSMKGAQEAMGQRQEMETSSNQLVTIAITKTARDTLTVTTTLDSIQVVGVMGMTPPGLDKLVGTKVTAKVAPTGQLYAVTSAAPDSLPDAQSLTHEMSNVLPKVRANLGAGVSWTDTTTRKVNQGGVEIDRKVVATYTVAGDTTVGGQRALKIDRKANTTMSGSGAQGGQPLTIEGTSVGTGSMYVTRGGTFLGFSNEEQVTMKVLLAATGMEVGITQTATTKVEKVK